MRLHQKVRPATLSRLNSAIGAMEFNAILILIVRVRSAMRSNYMEKTLAAQPDYVHQLLLIIMDAVMVSNVR